MTQPSRPKSTSIPLVVVHKDRPPQKPTLLNVVIEDRPPTEPLVIRLTTGCAPQRDGERQ